MEMVWGEAAHTHLSLKGCLLLVPKQSLKDLSLDMSYQTATQELLAEQDLAVSQEGLVHK